MTNTTEQHLAEALAENERLRALLPPDLDPDLVARPGRCQPCNVYVGMPGDPDGYLLGKLPTPEWAAHVIHGLNAFDWDGQVSEGRKVLDLPMDDNNAEAPTVRAYLVALLAALWNDPGYFSGKYAFGNSDWPWDFYRALINAGLITATYDDGDLITCDQTEGDRLIAAAVAELGVAR